MRFSKSSIALSCALIGTALFAPIAKAETAEQRFDACAKGALKELGLKGEPVIQSEVSGSIVTAVKKEIGQRPDGHLVQETVLIIREGKNVTFTTATGGTLDKRGVDAAIVINNYTTVDDIQAETRNNVLGPFISDPTTTYTVMERSHRVLDSVRACMKKTF